MSVPLDPIPTGGPPLIPTGEIEPPTAEEEPEDRGEEWKARSVPLGLAFFLLVVVAAAATGVWSSVDRLLEEAAAAVDAWGEVREAAARRHDLLAEVTDRLIRSGEAGEAVERWARARERFEGAASLGEEIERLPALDAAADRLHRAALQRREVLGPRGEGLLKGLHEAEGERRVAARDFNRAADRLRTTLRRIPTRWLGSLLGFEALPAYAVETPAGQSAPPRSPYMR
ncbi:MAG: hypothetical protein R6W82_08015 [bacterium]